MEGSCEKIVEKFGPDEQWREIVEQEVVGESLTEPTKVDKADCKTEDGEDSGAVSSHDAVGLSSTGAKLGHIGNGTANEGDLD